MEKTKMTSTMTEINGNALIKAFRDRGLNYSEIAEQFGYARTYFTTCANQGRIRTSLAELLWNEYNIPLDEYKFASCTHTETEAGGASKANMKSKDKGNEELYQTIYSAVYDAINDSQGGIFAAMYGALKKAMRENERS